jgi:hypothetical protein
VRSTPPSALADLEGTVRAMSSSTATMTAPQDALLTAWVRAEQASLWRDLDNHIRHAHNGYWSTGAEAVAVRIITAARLVGPTPPRDVAWSLVGGGVYRALLDIAGVPCAALTDTYLTRTQAQMAEQGSLEVLQRAYALTVAAMTAPRSVHALLQLAGQAAIGALTVTTVTEASAPRGVR